MNPPPDMPPAASRLPTDIGSLRLAKVYAQAVLEAADAQGCRAEVLGELAQIAHDVLPKAPAAQAVFASPRIPAEEKSAIVERLFAGKVLPTTLHALHVLAEHDRLGILSEIVAASKRLADERDGRRQAEITTAIPLDTAAQASVTADVAGALGMTLAPTFTVDPNIIGGLIVRVGDTVYDQSIATSLVRLGSRLKQRSIHEIQYRRDRLGTP